MNFSNKFLFIQKIVLRAMWQTLHKAQGIKEPIWGDRQDTRIPCNKCYDEDTYKGQWEQKVNFLNPLREVGILVGSINAGVENGFSDNKTKNKQTKNTLPPLQRHGNVFLNQQIIWCSFSLGGEECSRWMAGCMRKSE